MARISRWIGAILFLATIATALAVGCIRRYPAPTVPEQAEMPYSAVVTWRGIELPAPDTGGTPLPEKALRLAVGPGSEELFADSSLLGGETPDTTVANDLDSALSLLHSRTETIVVLVDKRLWATSTELCEQLRPLGSRVQVAMGRSGYDEKGPLPREGIKDKSRDPLEAFGLNRLCTGERVDAEQATQASTGTPP